MTCYGPSRVQVRKKSIFEGRSLSYGVTVPCGSCLGCRADQARGWAVRMMHEKMMHPQSWFVTLTYSDEEIPENGSLYAQDLSKFITDLRKDYPAKTVSYFGCGEYGGQTKRPHYHAVLFGPHFLDRHSVHVAGRGDVWRSAALERYWPHGFSELGDVTMASASYVAGYVRKKLGKDKDPEHYTRVDRETGELVELQEEFARMSLRPAIGRRWIEKYWRDVYPRDFVVTDGREQKPPRFYDKFMDFPDKKGGTAERRNLMEEVRHRRYCEMIELDKYTLDAKKKMHESRNLLFQGRLAL